MRFAPPLKFLHPPEKKILDPALLYKYVAARTRRNRAIHRRNLYSPYSRSSSQSASSQSSLSITSSPPIPASAPQMILPSVSTIRRPRGRPRLKPKPYTVSHGRPD